MKFGDKNKSLHVFVSLCMNLVILLESLPLKLTIYHSRRIDTPMAPMFKPSMRRTNLCFSIRWVLRLSNFRWALSENNI
ncbi:hypothetical protein QVD17_00469 [Tagetes erecta]|uniref:Uncharacterized protein n=1 Tax=Tagetes erecta TaxID=13708 RepID=A0AAD8P704_TARER|nr:hypothetical protein QVD17_00469 [Tagetes erecta]